MGKVIDFAAAASQPRGPGVSVAPLIDWFDSAEMTVAIIRLAAHARYGGKVPAGCDQYLFVLSGAAHIDAGVGADLRPQSWAILEEGTAFAVSGGAVEILSVTVPPPDAGRKSPGFRGGLKVMAVAELPVIDLPEEKKRRTYLATKALAAGSERGHAMIVRYTGEMLTKKHHHPNAESLFVMLSGKVRFLIDGAARVLGPGEAAFFPINDSHGLASADGNELSFLEFHIPGAFATVYDE
jgi:mannose-6-phosphate isomerase-like protein (cupin superfamily)